MSTFFFRKAILPYAHTYCTVCLSHRMTAVRNSYVINSETSRKSFSAYTTAVRARVSPRFYYRRSAPSDAVAMELHAPPRRLSFLIYTVLRYTRKRKNSHTHTCIVFLFKSLRKTGLKSESASDIVLTAKK